MKVGIVAGEVSGDFLGARLMRAMQDRAKARVEFIGVGGPDMVAAGLRDLGFFADFQISGTLAPLLRLPSLLRARAALLRAFRKAPVDMFVGVDFNVFNLSLAKRLKADGIATAQYVSPAVYGWRPGRVRSMPRVVDLLLALFPFEPALYKDVPLEVVYCGHPLADELPEHPDTRAAKVRLGLDPERRVLTLLPGSRPAELRFMAEGFLHAAAAFQFRYRDVQICVACVNAAARRHIFGLTLLPPECRYVVGDSTSALEAADWVLAKSGTGTLEAMLLQKPMVVAYRTGSLNAFLLNRLRRTPWVALPNILAGEELVPELLQEEASPQSLYDALETLSQAGDDNERLLRRFREIGADLRRGADEKAAIALLRLAGQG